jgi:hypothetical protein
MDIVKKMLAKGHDTETIHGLMGLSVKNMKRLKS